MNLKPVALTAMTLSLAAQQLSLEDRAVARAREVPVSTLEPGLPRQPLSSWLTKTAGPNVTIHWAATDCGEQTGNPDVNRGRDLPLCAEAVADLPGGRLLIVSIVMGSHRKGIVDSPQLLSVNIGKDGHFELIPKLRDLSARIKAGS